MYPAVIKVIPEEDYILRVAFDNGEIGILDMKPVLEFGVFRKLKESGAFEQVKVSFDTIEWDCGVDLDPEYVYQKCMMTKPAPANTCSTRQVETDSAVSESEEKYGR